MTNCWREWLTHGAEFPNASRAALIITSGEQSLTRFNRWALAPGENFWKVSKLKFTSIMHLFTTNSWTV
jgi:hypothetical protein